MRKINTTMPLLYSSRVQGSTVMQGRPNRERPAPPRPALHNLPCLLNTVLVAAMTDVCSIRLSVRCTLSDRYSNARKLWLVGVSQSSGINSRQM